MLLLNTLTALSIKQPHQIIFEIFLSCVHINWMAVEVDGTLGKDCLNDFNRNGHPIHQLPLPTLLADIFEVEAEHVEHGNDGYSIPDGTLNLSKAPSRGESIVQDAHQNCHRPSMAQAGANVLCDKAARIKEASLSTAPKDS